MIKKVLAISLASCSLSAFAAGEQTWNFVWSGPFASVDLWGQETVSDRAYAGSFSAIDANNDGLIVANEVTRLSIDGDSFAPCYATECTLEQFSYSGGNNLSFLGGLYYYQDPWGPFPPTRTFIDWNVKEGGSRHYRYCDQMCNSNTDQYALAGTTITVTAAVPEPHTYMMLGIGLLGSGYLARRKAHGRQQQLT
jgi:PEP-CTERM motif